ncbi:MAG TPA: condensation domain-containing protein, partial [Longimicrobium sp.]|nr:condensation domain-containing protein [Longimicrobium sp.]
TPSGTLAGIGELGEIAVRTPYLSRGYLNDAELTAARFVPNPLTGDPADRVYRTGDLGRYRPDGEVEPAGRVDSQVKVRGFRVELGEIAAALETHPSVRDVVVAARGEGDERILVAWAVARDGAEVDAEALRAHLRSILPDYMVPAAFVAIAAVPLTANGKVDLRALPEPAPAAASAPVTPLTPTEKEVAAIWREVLGVAEVRAGDDFFAVGGHSLRATRVLSRIHERLGVTLPVKAIFAAPTLAGLAAAVDAVRPAARVAEAGAEKPAASVYPPGVYPLSFAQQRLWVLMQFGSTVAYNVADAVRLTGPLDDRVLEYALTEIVRRHEPLRTRIELRDGEPVQVVLPARPVRLRAHDVDAAPGEARDAEYARLAEEEARQEFPLEGPFFRVRLLRASDDDHVLLITVHHVATDGWSQGIFRHELLTLYQAFAREEGSPLAELPTSYGRYALRQREELGGEALDRQIGYWKERLAGAPALLELPTDRPRPPVQSHRGARERFDLPRALLDGLQALGRGEGATLYMVMLGAFQLLPSKYSGSEDIVVGSPIAGRTRPEVEELIGFFANTLVLRTDLSGDPTFRELLGRVREGTLGAYEHQEVPFERLVAELQPERSMSHSPLFQVTFTLQNADHSGSGSGSGLAGLRMEGVAAEVETTRFDLGLTAVPHGGGVSGLLEYSTDLFDRSTVRRMLEHLQRVLEQVAADADVRLSELELLGEAERALVLEEWNRTEAGYPADRCIHELFEAQAARTPGAVAVRFEDESLTYRELNDRANPLAHYLRRRGVGPEVRVGICLERGVEMVVAILAVLKAGGAYVPLDPAHPADRLAFTLSDAGVPVLLAQEKVRATLSVPDGVELIGLDAAQAEIAAESTENPASGATPDSLAYVIYTSGSTGAPKGALIEHRNVARLFSATDAWFGF